MFQQYSAKYTVLLCVIGRSVWSVESDREVERKWQTVFQPCECDGAAFCLCVLVQLEQINDFILCRNKLLLREDFLSLLFISLTLEAAPRLRRLGSVFYLSAVLCADESSDGAEVVEVGAVQHPEQRLLGSAPLDHTALRLLRLAAAAAVLLRPQLGGGLAARVPLCEAHVEKHLSVTPKPLKRRTLSCVHTQPLHSQIKGFFFFFLQLYI